MALISRTVAACVAVGILFASGGAMAQDARVGPPQLYPDAAMTPGLADTTSADDLTMRWTCPPHTPPKDISKKDGKCTYSAAHRDVGSAEHKHVYDEYNVPADARNITSGEVDHFYPLCAGGSNDIRNLWYQPADNPWNGANFGFHEKDNLEAWICIQIKAGALVPQDAYDRLTADWVKFYLDAKPPHSKTGG